jgi:hypothetical protein
MNVGIYVCMLVYSSASLTFLTRVVKFHVTIAMDY